MKNFNQTGFYFGLSALAVTMLASPEAFALSAMRAQELVYSSPNSTYTVGVAISVDAPVDPRKSISSYSISPALPAGLALNPRSGAISGTPVSAQIEKFYTVRGYVSATKEYTGSTLTIVIKPAPAGFVGIPGTLDPQIPSLKNLGPANLGTVLFFDIGVALLYPDLANQFLQEQYTPGSPEYHHYLTPAEYCQMFGQTPATLATMAEYYTGFGLTVYSQDSSCNGLSVSGSVAQIEAAFQTKIDLYEYMGHPTPANSTPLKAPVSFSSIINDVEGIDGLVPPPSPGSEGSSGGASSTGAANSSDY